MELVLAMLSMLTSILEVCYWQKDEKMILLIKKKIFRVEFVEKIFTVVKIAEAENHVSDVVIKFLTLSNYMMANHPL